MKKEKKWENKLLFLIAVVILLGLVLLAFVFWNNLEKKEIALNFIVGVKPGFDLNSSALTFGSIPHGSGASRSLILKNSFNEKVFVSIFASKEISKMISISNNSFYLLPGEEREIGFSVYVNKNLSYGKYGGQIKISIKKYDFIF